MVLQDVGAKPQPIYAMLGKPSNTWDISMWNKVVVMGFTEGTTHSVRDKVNMRTKVRLESSLTPLPVVTTNKMSVKEFGSAHVDQLLRQ